jgi:molecular chaperone GrpE
MLYDRLLRKQAELENMRRRMQREKQEYFDQANAGLIRALLPSLDAFERALKARDQSRTIDLARGILWHPAFTTGD